MFDQEQSAGKPAEELLIVDEGDDFGWPCGYRDPQPHLACPVHRAMMVLQRARALVLTAVCVTSCQWMPPQPGAESPPEPPRTVLDATPDSIRDQVLARVQQYYIDFSRRDWVRYAEHFWPGATLTTIWQPPGEPEPRVVTTTVPAFVEQAPLGPGSKEIFEERMDRAEVRANGYIAQVWATYTARFGDPGAVDEWTGVDTFTLLRHNGEWRIVALAYAIDPVPTDSTNHR